MMRLRDRAGQLSGSPAGLTRSETNMLKYSSAKEGPAKIVTPGIHSVVTLRRTEKDYG